MDRQLRELAFSIVQAKKVDKKILDSFLSKLTHADVEKFLGYLRTATQKNTITVTTTEKSEQLEEYLNKNYKNMYVNYQIDDTIGGGVIVKIADDVYDYSVRNYIATTIDNLNKAL